jgi:hypothetical protein
MKPAAAALVGCLLLAAGCARAPDSYPPPMQRKALPDLEATPAGMMVSMSDLNAAVYIVGDISPGLEGGRWRWTNQRPELKLYLTSIEDLKLVWEFSIVETTFRTTGPVQVAFFVNGHPVGQLPCPRPGDYTFDQPVRPALLRLNGYNTIAAEADKLWVSPQDGVKLGFTLARAGFMK